MTMLKKQITSSLSKVLGKQVIISKMDITSYNVSEIEMIANTINGYIFTIKTLDIRSEFFESCDQMTCFEKGPHHNRKYPKGGAIVKITVRELSKIPGR